MKKITPVLIFSFFLLTAFKAPEDLVGKWEIVSTQEKDKAKIENPGRWIQLEADGILHVGIFSEDDPFGEEASLTGSWKYDEAGKALTMYYAKDDERSPQVIQVIKCSSKKMMLRDNNMKIHLVKMDET